MKRSRNDNFRNQGQGQGYRSQTDGNEWSSERYGSGMDRDMDGGRSSRNFTRHSQFDDYRGAESDFGDSSWSDDPRRENDRYGRSDYGGQSSFEYNRGRPERYDRPQEYERFGSNSRGDFMAPAQGGLGAFETNRGYQTGRSSFGQNLRSDSGMGYERTNYGLDRGGLDSSFDPRYGLGMNSNYSSGRDVDFGTNSERPTRNELRGGFFGKGPKGWKRSSDRIKEEVSEALYRNPRVDASDIEVGVEDNCIVLKGTVDSRETKREAERCVEHLSGVDDVRNELRVRREDSMVSSGMNTKGQSSTIKDGSARTASLS